jgi:hypothetical protein
MIFNSSPLYSRIKVNVQSFINPILGPRSQPGFRRVSSHQSMRYNFLPQFTTGRSGVDLRGGMILDTTRYREETRQPVRPNLRSFSFSLFRIPSARISASQVTDSFSPIVIARIPPLHRGSRPPRLFHHRRPSLLRVAPVDVLGLDLTAAGAPPVQQRALPV